MTGREKARAWREAALVLEEVVRRHEDSGTACLVRERRHIRDVIIPSLKRRAEIIEREEMATKILGGES